MQEFGEERGHGLRELQQQSLQVEFQFLLPQLNQTLGVLP